MLLVDFADCGDGRREDLHRLTLYMTCLLQPHCQTGAQGARRRDKALFRAVDCGIEMNDWVFGKQVAIGIKFKVIAGFVKQHLLGIFQMLPHRQLGGVGIFRSRAFRI